ncbi:DUF6892 domain-containing protein [Nocardia aurea]|uniref:DUF6892 domain-containing protein n=1 Tax=Nocardia aurea TaxID=2144174 RepID=UPI003F4CC542
MPPWSLEDTLKSQGFDGDLWQYSADNYHHQVVPQAQSYFENLEFPTDLSESVEQLIFDGGCQVYFECCPHRDGEGDQFDVSESRPDRAPRPVRPASQPQRTCGSRSANHARTQHF